MLRGSRLCLLILAPFLALFGAVLAGLRINHTQSFPLGVYWAIPKSPQVGDLVFFRPPTAPVFDLAVERGYMRPGGLEPYECMLKRIAAASGDVVTIDG